ncbi:MAG: hypothetical protein ABSH38_09335 [Verrucomicrobiota bacterium]
MTKVPLEKIHFVSGWPDAGAPGGNSILNLVVRGGTSNDADSPAGMMKEPLNKTFLSPTVVISIFCFQTACHQTIDGHRKPAKLRFGPQSYLWFNRLPLRSGSFLARWQ